MNKYGFDSTISNGAFTVNKIPAYEGQQGAFLGVQPGNSIKINYLLDARDIVLIEIRPGNK